MSELYPVLLFLLLVILLMWLLSIPAPPGKMLHDEL